MSDFGKLMQLGAGAAVTVAVDVAHGQDITGYAIGCHRNGKFLVLASGMGLKAFQRDLERLIAARTLDIAIARIEDAHQDAAFSEFMDLRKHSGRIEDMLKDSNQFALELASPAKPEPSKPWLTDRREQWRNNQNRHGRKR